MNRKVYQAGLKFMLCNAVKKLYNGEVIFHHGLDHGIYSEIICDELIDIQELKRIKNCMNEMVAKDLPIKKITVSKQEAYNFYKKKKMDEKANNVLNISNLSVSLFELEGQYNYFYSHDMPSSTKELDLFDLKYIADNQFVLVYPTDNKLSYTFRSNIYESFQAYDEWLDTQEINFVTDINKKICEGNIREFMKKNDIKIDSDIMDIAKEIILKKKRIVLLAGPSSSGKTTTSRKLSLYLASLGANALSMSLDDFFLERDETPLDEDGEKDFESVRALDLKMFNDCLNSLMDGNPTKLPTFNFVEGRKEFNEPEKILRDNEILVIEGLHALNPEILEGLDDHSAVYRIYVSPLTPLNVDRHNYVSTRDNRLLRRIARDFRTRGRSAETSIASWNSVKKGEEKYIYQYTDNADAVINTAHAYELGVLKIYVEPLLYDIKMDSPYYQEARRLLDHLKPFYTIPSEYIAEDNILREFIGGSVFDAK